MFLEKFRLKSVHGNVFALRGIALFSILALIVVNILVVSQLNSVSDNVAHEQTKIELNTMLHNRLLNLRTELQSISMSLKTHEIAFHQKNANNLISKVIEVLHTMERGGVIENRYLINFGNKDEAKRTLNYRKIDSETLDLSIIELKSHLDELTGLTAKLNQFIAERLHAITANDLEQQEKLEKKIEFFYKGIQPFFGRILENANRISFESGINLDSANEDRKRAIQRYVILTCVLAAGSLLLLFLVGSVLVGNIKQIVQERQSALELIKKNNENLERTVEDRTGELRHSLEQLGVEIEERKQAQKEVDSHAQFLQSTIEALSHPFYVIDATDYSILLQNTAARRLGGHTDTHCYQLTHCRDTPCDGRDHPCPLQQIKESGKPCKVDHIHFDKDGKEIYVEVHAYPILDDSGKVVKMIEYSLDVTDKKLAEQALVKANAELEGRVEARTFELAEEVQVRKKAEQAMKETALHFRFLIEHAPGVVMILNTGGFIVYVSPAIERMTGYAVDQLLHENLFSFSHEKDDEKLSFVLKMEPGGEGQATCEFRFMTVDGNWITVESVTINRLDEPSVAGIVMNFWDITQRKQMETRMQWLSQAVEQSPNSVVITDTHGIIEYVNNSFVKTTGYSVDEALGQSPRMLKSGQTPPAVYKALWKTIKAGRTWSGEFINMKKSGDIYAEHVIISPLRNEKKLITHYIATKENITELKKARQQAEAANKAKSAFLANMSHEIRTPLNGIVGFVDLLARKEQDTTQRKYIDIIKVSATHLQSVIKDILDLSKIESGKLELDLQEVRIRKKLEPAIELFYAKAVEKKLDFFSFIDPSLPRCLICDILRINQVMVNLINNSIKFTPENGRIDVAIHVVKIKESSVRIKFSVKDTGIGMDEEAKKKVFKSFSQADVSTTRNYGGTGLGLTISKNLIEQMGSQLSLTSAVGVGSTFSFTLDLLLCDDNRQEQEKLECRNQVQSIAVLVTEENDHRDEEHILAYLNSMEIGTTLVNSGDNLDQYNLIIAVESSFPPESIEGLYKGYDDKIILVISPEDLPRLETSYPGIKTITKPLNPSKIYDAVACVFGNREQDHSKIHEERIDIFTGTRVLVAEDNSINQILIGTYLKNLAAEYVLANNGLEVVEKFKQSSYDLVFMDINMPKMDGMEATAEIISYEKENGLAHVPIIALTAHALKGDREKMLDAGMDDYLAKPIDFEKLLDVFARYCDSRTEPAKPTAAEGEVQTTTYNIEDVATLLHISPKVVTKMVEMFADKIKTAQEAVPLIIQSGERPKMLDCAHSLAGVAGNLRFHELAACCQEIVAEIRGEEDTSLADMGRRLSSQLHKTDRLLANISLEG